MSGSDISWAICKSAPWHSYITMPASHHSFFTGQMPFLPPNQQRQSTEGILGMLGIYKVIITLQSIDATYACLEVVCVSVGRSVCLSVSVCWSRLWALQTNVGSRTLVLDEKKLLRGTCFSPLQRIGLQQECTPGILLCLLLPAVGTAHYSPASTIGGRVHLHYEGWQDV